MKAVNNVEKMQAEQQAQGTKLNTSHVLSIVGSMSILIGADVAFYTWNIIPGLIIAAICAIVMYYRVVPDEINARYFHYGLAERHSFMSGVTQIFGSGTQKVTVPQALEASMVDLYGGFKQDIESLISIVSENGDGKPAQREFQRIRDKYAGDIWFDDFMQQLETTQSTGIVNADAYHDIQRNADALFTNQSRYENSKQMHKHIFFVINICILVCLYAMISSFGLSTYIDIFGRSAIGWCVSFVYVIYTVCLFHKMYQYNYDMSILSVK